MTTDEPKFAKPNESQILVFHNNGYHHSLCVCKMEDSGSETE